MESKSICYNCIHGRRVASDQLKEQGYIGCNQFAKTSSQDVDFILKADELASGWVDLRSRPSATKCSGIMTNMQLMTKNVTDCLRYEERK